MAEKFTITSHAAAASMCFFRTGRFVPRSLRLPRVWGHRQSAQLVERDRGINLWVYADKWAAHRGAGRDVTSTTTSVRHA